MSKQFVIFMLNGESFGVDIAQVVEIQPPLEVVKVPNTPEFVEGIANLRGRVHVIYNLRKKFDFPDKESDENSKIIIVNIESMNLGFIVDEVNEIIRVDESSIEPPPPAISGANRRYYDGVAKVGDKMIILLNLKEVMSETEEEQVANAISEISKP